MGSKGQEGQNGEGGEHGGQPGQLPLNQGGNSWLWSAEQAEVKSVVHRRLPGEGEGRAVCGGQEGEHDQPGKLPLSHGGGGKSRLWSADQSTAQVTSIRSMGRAELSLGVWEGEKGGLLLAVCTGVAGGLLGAVHPDTDPWRLPETPRDERLLGGESG